MNKECFIAEDLLSLYSEGLLQEETKDWLENHLHSCEHCKEMATLTQIPLEKEPIPPTVDQEKMFKKINLKLSIYQIILIALSFLFAIHTSLLNDSFEFILSYTILGFLTYLFYRSFLLVATISFLPNFLWSVIDILQHPSELATIFNTIVGAVGIAMIHLLFAMAGSAIGFLTLKIMENQGD